MAADEARQQLGRQPEALAELDATLVVLRRLGRGVPTGDDRAEAAQLPDHELGPIPRHPLGQVTDEIERLRELARCLGMGTQLLVALGGPDASLDRLGVPLRTLQVERRLARVAAGRGATVFEQQHVGDPAEVLAPGGAPLRLVGDLAD